jgi:hypothetical protein
MIWEAISKKSIGDDCNLIEVCIGETKAGKTAFFPIFINNEFFLMQFPPHFFARYAERMELEVSGEELIREYFGRNHSYGFTYHQEMIVKNCKVTHCYGTCHDGVCLGLTSAKFPIMLMKTFVTHEMLKGEQIEEFAKIEKYRKEIHDR